MYSLIWVWINGWVNNREAGDLRRYRAHYDVTVMMSIWCLTSMWKTIVEIKRFYLHNGIIVKASLYLTRAPYGSTVVIFKIGHSQGQCRRHSCHSSSVVVAHVELKLTHWSLDDLNGIMTENVQANVSDWLLRYPLWNCPNRKPLGPTDDDLRLVQVICWCRQATSYWWTYVGPDICHYRRSLVYNGLTHCFIDSIECQRNNHWWNWVKCTCTMPQQTL